MDEATAAITRFATDLDAGRLPSAVLANAKRNILDTLLVARAGATTEGLDALLALAESEAGAGSSTVWARGRKLPAGHAAQINAMAAAALDFDSLCLTVHADCVVVPAALAVAEQEARSGSEFLAACVAGTEVMARLSRSMMPPQKGWSHTAVLGVFGAAVAAARLYRLTAEQMANALGICLSLAAGSQQSNIEQTLTKRLQPSLAAKHGVFAAQASRSGLTGPRSPFAGKAGLWSLYQQGKPEALLDGLGRDFEIMQTALKKYPVCACSHAAIEATLALTEGRPIAEKEIGMIEVTLTPFMAYMVGASFEPSANPVVTAQFSVRYAVAAALMRGRLDLAALAPDAIADPAVKRVADRIMLRTDQAASGEVEPARVRLSLACGQPREKLVLAMPGSADAPLSDDEFQAKLAICHARNPIDRPGGLTALQKRMAGLEMLQNISNLTALLG